MQSCSPAPKVTAMFDPVFTGYYCSTNAAYRDVIMSGINNDHSEVSASESTVNQTSINQLPDVYLADPKGQLGHDKLWSGQPGHDKLWSRMWCTTQHDRVGPRDMEHVKHIGL